MEKFKISDIQELFTTDVERFHSVTQLHLGQLLNQTPPPQDSLDEALRQTHTMKGLAATVHAWGLSCLGADFEKLLEVASSWLQTEQEKAREIFQFIRDREQDWFIMNQFTCMDMLPQAWDIYQSLRTMMEERWPGYLPAIAAGADMENKSVRLADLDLDEPTAATGQPAVPQPLHVVPPVLWQRKDIAPPPASSANSDRDVRQDKAIAATTNPAKPAPLQVVPPSLRSRKDAKKISLSASPAEVSPAPTAATPSAPPLADAPAKPAPLQVVPPTLRRVEPKTLEAFQPLTPAAIPAAGPAEQSAAPDSLLNPESSPAPAPKPGAAAAAPPPILRVAPPALKRRTTPAPGTPTAVPPAAESVDPAALAENSPASPTVPPLVPSPAFTPSADTDLLELLSQEVAGYLTELSANLAALASNLSAEAEWEKTRRLFHTIKGTAATFNLDAVSAPAKAAEARCIVAIEDKSTRTREAFDTCVQRAHIVAKALRLPFDESPLQAALENARAAAQPQAHVATTSAIDPEMAGFFVRDARDQIELIEQSILRWEKGVKPEEQLQAAQRGFHTLKGAGNSIGFTTVAQSVHEVEAFLENIATTAPQGDKPLFAFLLGAVDQIRGYLNELAKNPATPWRHDWHPALALLRQPSGVATPTATTTPPEATAPAATEIDADDSQTLRVDAGRLYELINLIGEMVVDRARLEKKIENLTALHRTLSERNSALTSSVQTFQQQFEFNLLQGQTVGGEGPILNGRGVNQPPSGAKPDGEFSELEFDRYDQFNILARSLVEISHDIEQLNGDVAGCLDSFTIENARFKQTSQALQSKVTNLSLIPVNNLFPRLKRAFRDALNVEHKEADFKLSGGGALLDKVVVDRIYAPLLHLVRNSVAHGIEDAVAREQLQKPARGQVHFSAVQNANQIIIQITDDGAGVNAAAVRQRAIDKGWLAADAPELTPDQVLHFISQPGFSTAKKVTSVSGRGIGLDVVRKDIEALNGSVELNYEAGRGSTWTLRLPLTLSISEAILADVGGSTLAFPLNFIEAGLILDEPSTRDEQGREFYRSGDHSLPVLRLAALLHLPGEATSNKGIIVSIGDRRAIVVVDRVLMRQEIVIKHLDSLTAQHPLFNGATLNAEGGVIPILNLPALLKYAETARATTVRPAARPLSKSTPDQVRVLIVDDSLSVRKVQERMLTELGCQAVTAADGLYALERLREQDFDLVFTDLEMPRLNGYELINDLRGNPAWAKLPIVVISSRGADKYITKAMNLGASTFLSKPFTQEQLQQVLRHYVQPAKVDASVA